MDGKDFSWHKIDKCIQERLAGGHLLYTKDNGEIFAESNIYRTELGLLTIREEVPSEIIQ